MSRSSLACCLDWTVLDLHVGTQPTVPGMQSISLLGNGGIAVQWPPIPATMPQ